MSSHINICNNMLIKSEHLDELINMAEDYCSRQASPFVTYSMKVVLDERNEVATLNHFLFTFNVVSLFKINNIEDRKYILNVKIGYDEDDDEYFIDLFQLVGEMEKKIQMYIKEFCFSADFSKMNIRTKIDDVIQKSYILIESDLI